MAAAGFTPISLYYSTTALAVPLAANLANGELALNTADMKLYAKDSSGVVTLLASSSGATGTVSTVSVVSANGLAGTVANATTTPAITLTTTVTGVLKGNGTAISAAVSGTDYAPATSGTSILYGNGSGGFSNVTIGSGVSFAGGTLSATGSGGTVTSVALSGGTTGLTVSGSPITSSGTITLAGTLNVANGGTGLTSLTAGYIPFGAGTSAFGSSANLFWDNTNGRLGIGTSSPGTKLDVAGSAYIRGDSSNATFTSPGQLAIKRSTGDPFLSFHGDTGAQIGYLQWQDAGVCGISVVVNQPLTFSTNASERFRIGTSGQWGIGGANYGTAGQVFTSNGSGAAPSWQSASGGSGFTAKTTNYTAVSGDNILANTSSASWTLTLPASPTTGNTVQVMDSTGTFDQYPLTVGRNGSTIMGASEDMILDVNGSATTFVYNGSTWRVI